MTTPGTTDLPPWVEIDHSVVRIRPRPGLRDYATWLFLMAISIFFTGIVFTALYSQPDLLTWGLMGLLLPVLWLLCIGIGYSLFSRTEVRVNPKSLILEKRFGPWLRQTHLARHSTTAEARFDEGSKGALAAAIVLSDGNEEHRIMVPGAHDRSQHAQVRATVQRVVNLLNTALDVPAEVDEEQARRQLHEALASVRH